VPALPFADHRAGRDQYRKERLERGTLGDQMRNACAPDDYVSPLLGQEPVASE